MQLRIHASADSYNPFLDTRGQVGHSSYFDVDRIPGTPPGERAKFRKSVKESVSKALLPMIHREKILLADMSARHLEHVAQSPAVFRKSEEEPFSVTTLDAGPSLDLWQCYSYERLGETKAQALQFLTPTMFLQSMRHVLLALREFHRGDFVHCDIHAGNICVPFERNAKNPEAVRPRFDRVCLIDFGQTLSARVKFDEPLRLDPNAEENVRRMSPALRSALCRDIETGRAREVHALDFRVDLYALGALGAQALEGVYWSDRNSTLSMRPAVDAWVESLLKLDCDDSRPDIGLHDALLGSLHDLLSRFGPVDVDWLIPRNRSPKPLLDTPLLVEGIEPSSGASVALEPNAPPTPATRSLPLIAALIGGGLLFAWTLWGERAGGRPEPPAASAPMPTPVPASESLPAPTPALAPSGLQGTPRAPDTSTAMRAIDDKLNAMIKSADAGDWKGVESAAKAIREANASEPDAPGSTRSPLVTAGRAAIERFDYGGAESILRRATSQAPNDWQAWSALGYALLRLNRLKDARAALTTSLRLRPNDASAWAHMGEILALQGKTAAPAAMVKLAVYFSTQRERTLAHLTSPAPPGLIQPEFQTVIRAQGDALGQLPARKP